MQTPHAAISQAAQALLERATDTRTKNAITKAEWHLLNGLEPVKSADGWLVKSATSPTIYRVSSVYGCPCKAGAGGNVCWHRQAVDVMIEAGKYTMPVLTSRVVYEPDTSEWF